jgi:hypothetical protein
MVMTGEEVTEWFEANTGYENNELNEQFLLIAEEVAESEEAPTVEKFAAYLQTYDSTASLTVEQHILARRIYQAYLRTLYFGFTDDGSYDEESPCCSYRAIFPRLPLPADLRGDYDLTQEAIQLDLEKQYWALPSAKRNEAFVWTCRGCYRKAFRSMEDSDEALDKRGRFLKSAFTKFNTEYIRDIEKCQDAEKATAA